MKALDKIKDMIDFCDAVGCHRALYESLKAVESELEALQSRSCESCKHGTAYLGTDRKWCEANIQQDGMTTVDKDFCCNRYEPKEQ